MAMATTTTHHHHTLSRVSTLTAVTSAVTASPYPHSVSLRSISHGMNDGIDTGTNSGIANGDSTYLFSNGQRVSRRRESSPMMPAFMVSAPGKVIVFGEHAVVHGKTAIAAAINLRSYLHVTTLSKSKRTVSLRFPDIGLVHTWSIDDLPWAVFHEPSKKRSYYDRVTSLDPDLLTAIQPHVRDISSSSQSAKVRKMHQDAATSFLYLFLSLGSPKSHGCLYTLRSTIPIGAGLGSSASIAVCLATALLLQLRVLSGPHPDQPFDEAQLQVNRINQWAFVAEMCIHGDPSGLDNTVATQGKAVEYKRTGGAAGGHPSVTPFLDFPELRLLLVDTKQPKSTSHQVAKVAGLKKAHPAIVGPIFDGIHNITIAATALIRTDGFDHRDSNCVRSLGELMSINHGLLVSLGMSHPRLERVRALVDHEGLGWTKLTGAGGGGCSISLIPDHVADCRMDELRDRLRNEDYQHFETTLGGNGVAVLWPAVLKNGMDEDDRGGMEIDLERFLNADGNDGVERLVGVHGGNGEREGWKFWRVSQEGK